MVTNFEKSLSLAVQIFYKHREFSMSDLLTQNLFQDIPPSGIECWYKLEGRTQRSNIQGRIRLKLWLSKREDRGTSEEEDNWSYIQQQERLYTIFINYEMSQAPVSILLHIILNCKMKRASGVN